MSKDLATPILKKSAVDEKGIIHYLIEGGMTKREHIAVMSMQGLISGGWYSASYPEEVAQSAVRVADALLKELEKEA